MSDYDADLSDDTKEEVEVLEETKKRRSSIFQSRPSHRFDVYSQDESEAQECNTQEEEEVEEVEEFNLDEYVKSLKAEYDEWKRTLKERKNKVRLLVKQEEALKDGVELDMNIFTESERDFIQARPNYQLICEKINDLVPVAVKVAQQNIEINHLNNNLIECLEEKIRDSKIKMIKKYTEMTDNIN